MNFDISDLLSEWEYEPGQIVVRRFKAKSGVERIQLRVDLGLLQMNTSGRPDGRRPYGRESIFDYYESRLRRYRKAHGGSDDGFQVKAEDCSKLNQEAVQFHHRYICLFQLQDYAGVIRDAERNLEVFEFLQEYAAADDLVWPLQHLIPQLLMMHTRAKAMLAVETNDYALAIRSVEQGLEDIRNFFTDQNRSDLIEQSGEIHSLESFRRDLETSRPLSDREKLQKALDDAVSREDYEKAAEVRDLLRNLNP